MNLNYPDPEENSVQADDDDSSWTSIPSDKYDYITKSEIELDDNCLDED